jgi:hypothetical protein
MPLINRKQLKDFANQGYSILPQIVSPELAAGAHLAIAEPIHQCPPKAEHRGPHFHFLFPELPKQTGCAL